MRGGGGGGGVSGVALDFFVTHSHTHFLHLYSDAEQEKRFLDRIDTPSKVRDGERERGKRRWLNSQGGIKPTFPTPTT